MLRRILKLCVIGLIIILLVQFVLIPYLDKKIELSYELDVNKKII